MVAQPMVLILDGNSAHGTYIRWYLHVMVWTQKKTFETLIFGVILFVQTYVYKKK